MIKHLTIASYLLIIGAFLYIIVLNSNPTQATPAYVQEPLNESLLYEKVNNYRVNQGLAPLKLDPSMCDFAKVRLSEIKTDWSHDKWLAGVQRAYYYTYAGENLARGQVTEDKTLSDWVASPTHLAVIVNPSFTRTCVESDVSGESTYTVQQFAD